MLRGGETDPRGRPLEVLVVKEARHSHGVKYKLPGGLADLGEDFGETACREVLEETGVTAVFEKLLTVRHLHGVQFGRSDIYAIAQLRAVTEDIVLDSYELEFAKWMDLKELRAASDHAMLLQAIDVCLGDGAVPLAEDELPSVVPGRRPYVHAPAKHPKHLCPWTCPGRLITFRSPVAGTSCTMRRCPRRRRSRRRSRKRLRHPLSARPALYQAVKHPRATRRQRLQRRRRRLRPLRRGSACGASAQHCAHKGHLPPRTKL